MKQQPRGCKSGMGGFTPVTHRYFACVNRHSRSNLPDVIFWKAGPHIKQKPEPCSVRVQRIYARLLCFVVALVGEALTAPCSRLPHLPLTLASHPSRCVVNTTGFYFIHLFLNRKRVCPPRKVYCVQEKGSRQVEHK